MLDKTIDEIIKTTAPYESWFSKYNSFVRPAMKMPRDSPITDKIQKNNLAQIWAYELNEKTIVIVALVKLDEFRD